MIRYEIIPVDGIEELVIAHVPHEVTVTVTASPSRGLEPTLAVTEHLRAEGYQVVPHLSARLVRDVAHLDELVARLSEAGVHEAFVPAGDATEPGDFPDAASLLRALQGRHLTELGITGYPESHHFIDDQTTISAMFEKAPMATYIVSQICFDAATIRWWVGAVRERGTHLPIWIGVPGVVHHAKLLRISMKIGLGESARFLRHHGSWMTRLMTRQFKPDRLLRGLAPWVTDAAANVAGFHLYTFNEVARTERWRRETLARLTAGR